MIGIILMIIIWLLAIWTVALIIEKIFGSFGVNMNLSGGIGSLIKLVFEIMIKLVSFLFKWLIMEPLRFIYRLLTRGTGGANDRDRLYSNGFLNFWEMAMLFRNKNRGFNLDSKRRLSDKDTSKNLYVQGSTGSGKGTTVLIPSLLNLVYNAVVINTGKVLELTGGWLQRQGYELRVFNLTDKSLSWRSNPIKDVKNSYAKAKKVSRQLILTTMGEKADDPFWNLSAISFLAACIALICQYTETKYHNMANVLRLVNQIGRKKHPTDLLEKADQTIYDTYMSAASNDKTLPSIISTITAALELYSDPEVALLTSEDTINFEDLRMPGKKLVIYINCPETEVSYYSSLLGLFIQNLCDFLMQTGSESAPIVHLHLDEFVNLGKLDNISTILSQNRKKNFPTAIYTQSLAQMKSEYGADTASSIVNACTNNKLFLPGQEDPDTLSYLSRVLGKVRQKFRDHRGRRQEEIRSVLAEAEVRSYKKSIYLKGGSLPATFKPKPFYKDKTLLQRSQIPLQPLSIPNHKSELEYYGQL